MSSEAKIVSYQWFEDACVKISDGKNPLDELEKAKLKHFEVVGNSAKSTVNLNTTSNASTGESDVISEFSKKTQRK